MTGVGDLEDQIAEARAMTLGDAGVQLRRLEVLLDGKDRTIQRLFTSAPAMVESAGVSRISSEILRPH